MRVLLEPPRRATAELIPEIVELLRAVFRKERDWAAELPWQYLANPCGTAWCVNARTEEGELVGHYALIPTAPLADSRFNRYQTYLSLNTAVHPKAQGKGIFKSTANRMFGHLESLGPSIVLGVANANSMHGFIKYLGFHSIGQLSLKVFAPWAAPPVVGERALDVDEKWLEWRTHRPDAPTFRNPRSGAIVRLLCHAGVSFQAVLSLALPKALIEGAELPICNARTRLLAPQLYSSSSDSSGGFSVPMRLRPSPLNYICRILAGDNDKPLLEFLRMTRFEFLDFDVV